MNEKKELAVLQAHSLRDLTNKVNEINFSDSGKPILKEDIVDILRIDGTFFLMYFK